MLKHVLKRVLKRVLSAKSAPVVIKRVDNSMLLAQAACVLKPVTHEEWITYSSYFGLPLRISPYASCLRRSWVCLLVLVFGHFSRTLGRYTIFSLIETYVIAKKLPFTERGDWAEQSEEERQRKMFSHPNDSVPALHSSFRRALRRA